MRDAYHVDDIESLDIILKNTQLASAQRGKSHISVYVKESGSELRRVPDVRDIRFERRNPSATRRGNSSRPATAQIKNHEYIAKNDDTPNQIAEQVLKSCILSKLAFIAGAIVQTAGH